VIRIRAMSSALALAVALVLSVAVTPAHAASSYLCSGWTACRTAGYTEAGYQAVNQTMFWRMAKGHNCTNYAAYRMVKNGMRNARPWVGSGMAYNWGPANAMRTDRTPIVGAVAWWKANVKGAGRSGHVAYIEQVISIDEIIISEDNWGGNFHWRRVRRESGWPTAFIHFKDAGVGSPRGYVDAAFSAYSQRLTLRGWSADPNATSRAVKIRVYVGGRPGVGKRYDLDAANNRRPDVARVFPAYGPNHGFQQTISVSATGTQAVYVYGMDTADTAGTTALLGRAVVNIQR
jgi:surface antigen